jgi:HD-like signal output (HDOD) protein
LSRSPAMALLLPFLRPTPGALVRNVPDLPPVPKVLQKLEDVLSTPNTSLEEIAGIVHVEPGLAGRVVKLARSAHFGRGIPATTIMEALQRVGLQGVHEVVTYAVASQIVGRPLRSYGLEAEALWSRAVACAIAASSLAERCDVDRVDAYTAGLMHGIGLLVIDRHAAQQRKLRRLASAGYPLDFAPAEREWLGFSHAEAGAALLELWGFPAPVVAAVRHQLEPEATEEHRKLSMVLAAARWARSLFCVTDEKIPELPAAHWLEESGVTIGDFGEWLGAVRRRYVMACTELRVE